MKVGWKEPVSRVGIINSGLICGQSGIHCAFRHCKLNVDQCDKTTENSGNLVASQRRIPLTELTPDRQIVRPLAKFCQIIDVYHISFKATDAFKDV